MAQISCSFFSDALEMGTSVSVVLPQATEAQIGVDPAAAGGDPPVLYLLHGLSDDHTAWVRYTSIERYAAAAGLAVVMPAVGRSFYADELHGHRYWTFVSEELPRVMRSFFRFSERPEDTFVAGLSMGGYGALKLALTHPDRFAAAASLSGGLDVVGVSAVPRAAGAVRPGLRRRPGARRRPVRAAGRRRRRVAAAAARLLRDRGQAVPMSRRFAAEAEAAGAEVTTDFRPGDHEWGLWDAVIRDVIDWLPRGG